MCYSQTDRISSEMLLTDGWNIYFYKSNLLIGYWLIMDKISIFYMSIAFIVCIIGKKKVTNRQRVTLFIICIDIQNSKIEVCFSTLN